MISVFTKAPSVQSWVLRERDPKCIARPAPAHHTNNPVCTFNKTCSTFLCQRERRFCFVVIESWNAVVVGGEWWRKVVFWIVWVSYRTMIIKREKNHYIIQPQPVAWHGPLRNKKENFFALFQSVALLCKPSQWATERAEICITMDFVGFSSSCFFTTNIFWKNGKKSVEIIIKKSGWVTDCRWILYVYRVFRCKYYYSSDSVFMWFQ